MILEKKCIFARLKNTDYCPLTLEKENKLKSRNVGEDISHKTQTN